MEGLFAGLSLDGTILIERKDANRDFYGSPIPAQDILEGRANIPLSQRLLCVILANLVPSIYVSGRVPPPEVASKLYEIIEAAEGLDESGLPAEAYMPGVHGEHEPVDPTTGYAVGGGAHEGGQMVFDAGHEQ